MSSAQDAQATTDDPVGFEEGWRDLMKPASAEFMGCCFFLFMACGMAMSTVGWQQPGSVQIGIALSFGFTIFVLAFTIGHISGGHLNTAVTVSFMAARKISVRRGLMYIVAQIFGGLLGAGLLRWWVPHKFSELTCVASNTLAQDVGIGQAFGLEFVLTFFLLVVVNAASDSSKSNTTLVPLAIGYAVTVAHLCAIPLTGCSINPMRSFASAFVSLGVEGCGRVWTHHWIFWLAPILGGISGTFCYNYFFNMEQGVPRLTDGLLTMYSAVTNPFGIFRSQRAAPSVR